MTTVSNDLDLIIGSKLNGKLTIEEIRVSAFCKLRWDRLGAALNLIPCKQRCPQCSWSSGSGKGDCWFCASKSPCQHSLLASIWSTTLPVLVITLLLVARDNVINPQKQNCSLEKNRSAEEGKTLCPFSFLPAPPTELPFYLESSFFRASNKQRGST